MATTDEGETGSSIARRPLQFSLRRLLLLPVWLALFFAAIAWGDGEGAVCFLLISCVGYMGLVRPRTDVPYPFHRRYLLFIPLWFAITCLFTFGSEPTLLLCLLINLAAAAFFCGMALRYRSVHWLCASFAALILTMAVPPLIHGTGSVAIPRLLCTNNLKLIGQALHNYHDVHGSFPPAYVADTTGQRLYSWRVLLLPFIDQQRLYDAWNLDEPWDSPNNAPLAQTVIGEFRCPADKPRSSTKSQTMTSYLAVVGAETMWPDAESRRFADVADGPSSTIAVVEVRNSGVHWAEPRDLHVDQMAAVVNPAAGQGISSDHPDGANVLYVDGRVEFLGSQTAAETLRRLLTIAGGEPTAVEPQER